MKFSFFRSVHFAQALAVVLFCGLWEVASRLHWVDSELLPPLSTAAGTLYELMGTADFRRHAGDTFQRIIISFVIGAPVAVAFGFFIGEKADAGAFLKPIVQFTMAVPQSVFLPIFILVFGVGDLEKIVFGVTHIFFVVAVNTVAAVAGVSRGLVQAARSFGASRAQVYRKIYLPAMLPLIINGLRLGMVFNVVGILLAEMYASRTGLGVLIFRWAEANSTDKLMAAIVLISITTILFNEVMRSLEARTGRWQRAQETQ